MRQENVTPEVWQAHRKLRKKIASAKWYAQKKKREIQEENRLRRELEAQYQAKQSAYLWTPEMRAYQRAVVDHIHRGYPVRPSDVPPLQWSAWADVVEEHLLRTETESKRLWHHIPWADPEFRKTLRQLGMREARWKAARTERADSISSAASDKRRAQSRSQATSSSLWLWTCSVPGVVFAGLVRQGRTTEWPRVIDQMIQVFHPSNPTDQSNPWPVAQTIPPNQKPTQKTHHDPDDMLPDTREGLIRWIQNTVFPEPPVALDCLGDYDTDSSLDTDVLNDAFGESPGYVSDDTTWSTDVELRA